MTTKSLPTDRDKWNVAERSQRTAALAAVVVLHIFAIYPLANASRSYHSRLDVSVLEADIIPLQRQLPSPPPLPPVMLQAISPIAPPPVQMAIVPPPNETVAVSQAIATRDVADRPAPLTTGTSVQADWNSVVRPRPIAGPAGADRYPRESLRAKESGTVVMVICVSQTGRVDSVAVSRSSGFPRLDRVALGMASEYRFKPATLHGHPVAACADFRIIFKVT
jgi:protein TonB